MSRRGTIVGTGYTAVVEHTVYEIVCVVAVRHCFVPAVWALLVTCSVTTSRPMCVRMLCVRLDLHSSL